MIAPSCDQKKIKLQYVPLTIAGLMSWLYMIGGPTFAETHIELSFLNFPVFVGELALAVCLAFCALVVAIRKDVLRPAHLWLAVYVGFVLVKTWLGYQKHGALACRHAALYYYPLFSVVTGLCADRDLFRNTIFKLGVIALGFLAFYLGVYSYFAFPLTLLVVGCVIAIPHRTWRTLVFTVMLVLLPYETYFEDGRSRIVGNAAGFISLVGLSLAAFIRMRKRVKAAVVLVFACLLCAVVVRVADKNAIRSLTSWDVMRQKWDKYSGIIEREYDRHEFKTVTPRIYNRNSKEERTIKEGVKHVFLPDDVKESAKLTPGSPPDIMGEGYSPPRPADPPPTKEAVRLRSLDSAQNNILFRIFIWRDVWRDMLSKKSFLFGEDFGFPFRSHSLEVLGWADDAWGVDGWVAIHNSYIDMIYRGGVFGLALVVYLFMTLLKLIKLSVQDKKSTYIFAVAMFICWMTYANFTEFFELPYTAIPFWVLWGCCLGISKKEK